MMVVVPTSAGTFRAEFRNDKLAALHFPNGDRRTTTALPAEARVLRDQLAAYFQGRRKSFSLPLDLSAGTQFQRKVWRALQRIPYGKTKSYGEIAREIGSPQAARAVGMACGRNALPIIVPCHRVVAHGNKLGGFSSGLWWKKRLLAIESKT